MKLQAEDEETDECNTTQKSTAFCFLFVYGLHENIWSWSLSLVSSDSCLTLIFFVYSTDMSMHWSNFLHESSQLCV